MIAIENLVKRHGAREVLHGVSLEARPGRVTGFVGPNGAGKSSTLRCLLGLDRADGGRALIGGRPYRELREPLRTVGAVLDGSGAHPSRTARGHLGWVASGAGISRHRVAEVLDVVGLSEAAGRRVRTFSLGMGQRLGLATARAAVSWVRRRSWARRSRRRSHREAATSPAMTSSTVIWARREGSGE